MFQLVYNWHEFIHQGELHDWRAAQLARLGFPRPLAEAVADHVDWHEITLGAALLLPVVPAAVAGAGLAAFSGGLLGLYARTPGMRKEGTPFPTQQGIALAKDAWMLGIGLGLVIDDLTDGPEKDN